MRRLPWQTPLLLLIYFGIVSCSLSSARSGLLDAQPFKTQQLEASLIECVRTQSAGAASSKDARLTEDCLNERANKYRGLLAKELDVQEPDLKTFLEPLDALTFETRILAIIAAYLKEREEENDQKWTPGKLAKEMIPNPLPALNLPRQKSAKSLTVDILSRVDQSAASTTAFSESEIKILSGLVESLQLSQDVKDRRLWLDLLYGPEQLFIFLAFLWSWQKFNSTKSAIKKNQSPGPYRWGVFWAGSVLVLGFVGTVRGMYGAIPYLSQALGGPGVEQSTAISSMATTLGPAFATTLIALVLTIILNAFDQHTRSIADKHGVTLPS